MHGHVRFDPAANGDTLGFRFLELAQNVGTAPDLAAIASVEPQRLRDVTGETAYLAVLLMARCSRSASSRGRTSTRLPFSGGRRPSHARLYLRL